ncbi:MAG: bifunctional (p)ppGpp synthetase/guanosine-3',5'-bis(diphosphate) 3'-pyrophosphohydrolase [Myxococcales bacterium]|nr:bifunctional (p)ppGpp synthetase/guanosine-3',5'-bis(diphosphate) 3'-pyrophosphohydrolase [Myxococcales bacterium]
MIKLSDILDRVASYHPSPNIDLIKKAYVFAANKHKDQRRESGEPYLMHPLAVADLVAQLRLDESSICAGLLHDTVEDTDTTLEDVAALFNEQIAQLVDGLTKISKINFHSREERQAENFRKMIVAMSRDIRVILIKLCDRVHNMRTLDSLREEKQRKIARETLDIYAPLANRLGINWIKLELEDHCLKYLYPNDFYDLVEKVAQKKRDRDRYIDEVIRIIRGKMEEHGFNCEVAGRPKHFYSIWRKMRTKNLEFDQLYDIIAFRVIMNSVPECYEALGYLHTLWKPIPGRFKDYIALPKPNMYQSLHTSVLGPNGERVEIQIRTNDMHRVAEEGIAAHWRYKEGGASQLKDEKKFAWLKQLVEWQQDLKDPTEFLDSVRVDLFADEVYVFTPLGEVKVFPKGATPIDFAYAIHSEVGYHCAGAKVNGQIVPLNSQLRNGNIVEIITNPNKKPNKDWLKYANTARAKNRIRQFLRKEQRERSSEIGRELLEKSLRKYSMSYSKMAKSGKLESVFKELKVHSAEDLQINIGYGKIQPEAVVKLLVPQEKLDQPQAEEKPEGMLSTLLRKVAPKRKSTGVLIQGIDEVMVRFGRCCNPLPGDDIVGFITRGRGITIHLRECQQTLNEDPERRVEVQWDVKEKQMHPISIRVICSDQPGLLASISQAFTDKGVNIHQANCRSMTDSRAINIFQVLVADSEQLQRVCQAISQIKGVYSVERVRM